MPLYEYQCRDCKTRSEVIRRFSDPPLTTCEACGGTLDKLLSAPAFQLKGSGWYKTDYAPGAGKPTAKTEAEGGGESSIVSNAESSSEAKDSDKKEPKKAETTDKAEKKADKSPAAKASSG
jgi:putative FmdB family regulatory protein